MASYDSQYKVVAGSSINKKRKVQQKSTMKQLMRFLDIEAGVDVNVEDSDAEDAFNFIHGDDDDEPIDEDAPGGHQSPNLYANNYEAEGELLHRLAQRIEERARDIRCPYTLVTAEADTQIMPTIQEIADAPLVAFKVPPHSEVTFMRFLYDLDLEQQLRGAFTREIGSGIVYVETTDYPLLSRKLKSYAGYWRLRRRPRVLEVVETAMNFTRPDPLEVIGRFKRLRLKFHGLMPGDLVFVLSENEFLGIPRIPYPKLGGKSPPAQGLFKAPVFIQEFQSTERRLRRVGDTYVVEFPSCTFLQSGLQLFKWQIGRAHKLWEAGDPDIGQLEYDFYVQANDPAMRTAVYDKARPSLQEGDPVVVVSGINKGQTGHIALIADEKVQNAAGEFHVVRCAVVQQEVPIEAHLLRIEKVEQEIPVQQPIMSVSSTNVPHFIVKLSHLRPHIMYYRRPIQLGDLVKVVDGNKHRGDVVRISRGSRTGTVGIIVAIRPLGQVRLYPTDALRNKRLTSSSATSEEQITFNTPSATLEHFQDDWHAETNPGHKTEATLWHKSWLSEMYTGSAYMGLDVMIAYQHQRKGRFATIIGYDMPAEIHPHGEIIDFRTDFKGILHRTVRPYEGGISLQVQLEGTAERLTLPIDQVVEKNLPGEKDRETGLVKDLVPERQKSPVPPEFEVSKDTLGEDTGMWLTRPEFVGKRIDVQIVGVARSQYKLFTGKRALSHEGKTGYLAPFGESIKESSFGRTPVHVKLDSFRHNVYLPADALRPLRKDALGVSIASSKQVRVIVIGPDADQNWDMVGTYGETMTNVNQWPNMVLVRFAKSSHTKLFPLKSLCRSLNVRVEKDGVVADSVSFE
ncbi:hypothetical protein B0H12DRAFT_1069866 [Mycena haematopus]|nr:hypothetical protein B0H12DRAFT_1069866 [Mycena haematopus]